MVRLFDVGQEATGVVAFGQIATGVIAIGQVATGVVAVGQLARGVFAIGQVAVGVLAAGQLGIGAGYGAGMLGVGAVGGGLWPLGVFGKWPLRSIIEADVSALTRVTRPWRVSRILVMAVLGVVVFEAAVAPVWRALYDAGGILHQPR